jgi:hypothetical protein
VEGDCSPSDEGTSLGIALLAAARAARGATSTWRTCIIAQRSTRWGPGRSLQMQHEQSTTHVRPNIGGYSDRMATVRAMVIMNTNSPDPSDRYVNTWHFFNEVDYTIHRAIIASALAGFYTGSTPATFQLSDFFSGVIRTPLELRTYNLDDPEPREPTISTIPFTESSASTRVLPEEVALVMSFTGGPPRTARRRGRVYLGPFRSEAIDVLSTVTSHNFARPEPSLIAGIVSEGEALMEPTDLDWCIRSSLPIPHFVPVVDGWVDNSFDTQRRRGPDASLRTEWP